MHPAEVPVINHIGADKQPRLCQLCMQHGRNRVIRKPHHVIVDFQVVPAAQVALSTLSRDAPRQI